MVDYTETSLKTTVGPTVAEGLTDRRTQKARGEEESSRKLMSSRFKLDLETGRKG